MNIIRATDPYGPSINKDAYLHERDPTINDVLKYLKHPYLRLYSNRIDAIKNRNPFNNRSRIKTDLNINLGDTRKKLWYGTDNNQKLIDAKKRLAFSKSTLPDDLNEKIGKEFTQKAGKKLRTKTYKTKKKGGLNKKKDVKKIDSWVNPHVPGKQDCCPCVFHYMGLIDDDEYAELYDKYGETGMYEKDIESFFKSKYPHFNFEVRTAQLNNLSIETAVKFIKDMFNTIHKGHVAVGGIIYGNNIKHCVVFGKTNDNKMAIHDSQMNRLYNNDRDVLEYLYQNNVSRLFFLDSNYTRNKIPNKVDRLVLNINNIPRNFHTPDNSYDSLYDDDVNFYTPTKSKTKSKTKTKSKSKSKTKTKTKTKSN